VLTVNHSLTGTEGIALFALAKFSPWNLLVVLPL